MPLCQDKCWMRSTNRIRNSRVPAIVIRAPLAFQCATAIRSLVSVGFDQVRFRMLGFTRGRK
jgi:hypothetical protein